MKNIETMSLSNRFEHLLKLMSSSKFLKMEGLGNEVPFFICPFAVKESTDMNKAIAQLIKQLQQKQVIVLVLNLYQVALDILKQRNILDKIIDMETDISKADLFSQLQSVLDPEKHIIPEIKARIKESNHQVLFITGVGEVFPYIRLHSILNNMQSLAHAKPSVFFFPGEYNANDTNGSTLRLFGVMDDKYYRAFNIYHCLTN